MNSVSKDKGDLTKLRRVFEKDFIVPFSVRKSPLEMTLDERKIELILALLVEVADQDYLTARWGFQNAAFHTFYWSGAQALEKYMKSALLLRGEAVEQYNHNLNALLARIRRTASADSLPKKLKIPKTTAYGRKSWSNKSVDQYINYMNIFGSPDNRYAFEGLFINGPVLHALDFVCLHLRSNLNAQNFLSQNLFTYRNQGRASIRKGRPAPSWMIDQHLPLERLFLKNYQVGETAATRKLFRTMNLAFFTDKYRRGPGFGGISLRGSPLANHLVRFADEHFPGQTVQNREIVAELRTWVGESLQLSERARKAVGLPSKKVAEKGC